MAHARAPPARSCCLPRAQSWPPSGEADPGVVVLKALVDHGAGREARRAHATLSSALEGERAHDAVLSMLRAAAPRDLRVDAVALVARADGDASGGGKQGRISQHGHVSARELADRLRAMGAGSFQEDAFMDGSVHGGFARGLHDAPKPCHDAGAVKVVGGGAVPAAAVC